MLLSVERLGLRDVVRPAVKVALCALFKGIFGSRKVVIFLLLQDCLVECGQGAPSVEEPLSLVACSHGVKRAVEAQEARDADASGAERGDQASGHQERDVVLGGGWDGEVDPGRCQSAKHHGDQQAQGNDLHVALCEHFVVGEVGGPLSLLERGVVW